MIYLYLLGFIVVSNLLVIWKLTNLHNHIFNFFKKDEDKIYTKEDLEDYLALEGGWFGELLICPLCLSTHLSWITACFICFFSNCSLFLIPIGMFSWPVLAYFFFCLIKVFHLYIDKVR